MYKLLIGILIVCLVGCNAKPRATTIKNLRLITKTENCETISVYVGNYVFDNGDTICCYNCEVTNSVAEQVLKNPQFEVGCVSENVMTVSMLFGFLYGWISLVAIIAIKEFYF